MPIISVGLDVHEETIAAALAEAGKRSEVREAAYRAAVQACLWALAGMGRSRTWLASRPQALASNRACPEAPAGGGSTTPLLAFWPVCHRHLPNSLK